MAITEREIQNIKWVGNKMEYKFYNEDQKKQFIDTRKDEVTMSGGMLERMFTKTAIFEEKNNKDAPPVAPEGAPDAYGAPPPGWDEACEKQFQEDAPQNPGKTRQDWWDFWMADEGGDDE